MIEYRGKKYLTYYECSYNNKQQVVVYDVINKEYQDLSTRPDIKQRAETIINKGGILAIVKRGSRNGFVTLTQEEVNKIFGLKEKPLQQSTPKMDYNIEKPTNYIIGDLQWKFTLRNISKNKNQLLVGPSGCGKTQLVFEASKVLGRKVEYFNLGATQDPRSTLIGNTHYDPNKGTYFVESDFIKAIQTPNTIILLDEVSRAHPEAWNILMTVLDDKQRYLKIDESNQSEREIKVDPSICFIGTANIGNEYTSARMLDKALMDRFLISQLDFLDKTSELNVLSKLFPSIDYPSLEIVVNILAKTRKSDDIDGISTRKSIELCDLINDGFNLQESVELILYPYYPDEDDLVNFKQILQKEIIFTDGKGGKDKANKIANIF